MRIIKKKDGIYFLKNKEEYKQHIIDIININYKGKENTLEYKNIMKNINKIIKNVYPELKDLCYIEQEVKVIFKELKKYKEEQKKGFKDEIYKRLIKRKKMLFLYNKILNADKRKGVY